MHDDGAAGELQRLVAEAMGVPATSLSDDSSSETIANWDSAAGMSLMVLLEETYGIAFEAEEMVRLTSVGAIRAVLREKGIAL
jgi:acyl carrier protein